MSKIEIAEHIGIKILDHEHEAVMDYSEDDSEYIPRLKRIIDSISDALLQNACERQDCIRLQKKLYEYAKGLYFKSWIIHAEEQEGPGNFDVNFEQKCAFKTFDEHYLD